MTIGQLRRWHRTSGIILAIFLVVQVVTGMIMSGAHLGGGGHEHSAGIEISADSHGHDAGISVSATGGEEGLIGSLHHGGGALGSIYRLILGLAVLWQGVTGLMIFIKMKT